MWFSSGNPDVTGKKVEVQINDLKHCKWLYFKCELSKKIKKIENPFF